METENKQRKNSLSQILIVLVVIIVVAALSGSGVYLWTQNQNKEDQTPTRSQSTSKSTSKTEKEPAVSPTTVAETFILATLGTVPGAKIDYDKAKTLLAEKLKDQFTEATFIPEFYGIQQGPDNYSMKTENINDGMASVNFDVRYGDMMQGWSFILVKEADEWKIDEFHNDAQ